MRGRGGRDLASINQYGWTAHSLDVRRLSHTLQFLLSIIIRPQPPTEVLNASDVVSDLR